MNAPYCFTPPIRDGIIDSNDCVVRALQITADIPYTEAHLNLMLAGRRDGRGMHPEEFDPVYLRYGLIKTTLKRRQRLYVNRRSGTSYWKFVSPMTVASFLRTHRRGAFAVSTDGHIFAAIDGIVYDCAPFKPRAYVHAFYERVQQ